MIDPTTWGNSLACKVLSEVLEEIGDKSLAKTTNMVLNHFFINMRRVDKIDDGREFFKKLTLEHHQKIATTKLQCAHKVHSLVNNIMMARHRRRGPQCFTPSSRMRRRPISTE